MLILVNALSVSNQSGRHVLLGHLSRLAKWTQGVHEFVVVYHSRSARLVCNLGPNVRWHQITALAAYWQFRAILETIHFRRLCRHYQANMVFTPSGTPINALACPQAVFAQNPWCFVRSVHYSTADKLKAGLQRTAYRSAMHKAVAMIFNSKYMRDAYNENAGFVHPQESVVYQAVSDDLASSAEHYADLERRPLQIVSVSAMARHKGMETVINALAQLHQHYQLPARLVCVGSWPDAGYQAEIQHLVSQQKLDQYVTLAGLVSDTDLHHYYAESKVFCLMSHCESFGIPAVEAQAFGTPVVSSNCCAIPEVCGNGGIFPDPGDAHGTAKALHELLSNPTRWKEMSRNARANAARYRWETCTRPLLDSLENCA